MKHEEWGIINENFKKLEKSVSNLLIEIECLKSAQKELKKDHLKILISLNSLIKPKTDKKVVKK